MCPSTWGAHDVIACLGLWFYPRKTKTLNVMCIYDSENLSLLDQVLYKEKIRKKYCFKWTWNMKIFYKIEMTSCICVNNRSTGKLNHNVLVQKSRTSVLMNEKYQVTIRNMQHAYLSTFNITSNPWSLPMSIMSLAWFGTTVMTWKALEMASASSLRPALWEYLRMASNNMWYLVSLWIGFISRSVSRSLKPSFSRMSWKNI